MWAYAFNKMSMRYMNYRYSRALIERFVRHIIKNELLNLFVLEFV